MNKKKEKLIDKLPLMLQNFAVLLKSIRARDHKSQEEMGNDLSISRVCYGAYENNRAKNTVEGMPLSLLIKTADLEGISLYRMIDILCGETPHQRIKGRAVEPWKQKLLDAFLGAPRKHRDRFLNFLDKLYTDHDPTHNRYLGDRTTWSVRTLSLISRLPITSVMSLERSVLEESFRLSSDISEKQEIMARLEEISDFNFKRDKKELKDK